MPLCKCSQCLASTNGVGKEVHRTTISRHMDKERMKNYLDNAYQSSHSEENLYSEDEENLPEEKSSYEDNLYEDNLYEYEENLQEQEETLSPMEISDNEASTEIPSSFQNEEISDGYYENDDHYYEDDDSIYDSQAESEFDNVNSNINEGDF